jgi:hypothetical protein
VSRPDQGARPTSLTRLVSEEPMPAGLAEPFAQCDSASAFTVAFRVGATRARRPQLFSSVT